MADDKKEKNVFSATNRDKIRAAHNKGKRVINIDNVKLALKTDKKHGTIIVTPVGDAKLPLAVVDTQSTYLRKMKERDKSIQQHHKEIKSGEKKARTNPSK